MLKSVHINQGADDKTIYGDLLKQLPHLVLPTDNFISNLSNFTALIKTALPKISWIGFYIFDGQKLFLGPFQGKLACTSIEIGSGVCGTSARLNQTIIVDDVEKFPGHIACEPESRSEIVVPINYPDGRLFGVLDLDSTDYSAFGDDDKLYLEKLIDYLEKNILPNSIKLWHS